VREGVQGDQNCAVLLERLPTAGQVQAEKGFPFPRSVGRNSEMYEDYDDFDDDDEEPDFDCHMGDDGFCGKAGSEECDFDCPYRD